MLFAALPNLNLHYPFTSNATAQSACKLSVFAAAFAKMKALCRKLSRRFYGLTLPRLPIFKWPLKRYNMIQRLTELQRELLGAEQWREELARQQKYEEAACNRDKERLLRREMARLRLKLKLGREIEKD